MKRLHTVVLCMGLLGSFLSAPVGAADDPEQFPQRPIRLVVPWSPGAFTDTLARLVADLMGRGLGQPLIVENRPGANGILGTESVAKSAPDGYTLLIATAETHAINPSIYTKLRYDPVTDFSPVGSIASVPLFLVTHPDVAEKTFPELMNAARKTPGRFKYASWGTGSTGHLAIELLNAPAGIDMVHVPYKGGGQALPDVLAGRVDIFLVTTMTNGQLMRENRLRPLAVTSIKRSVLMPAVPAVSELGYPGYDIALWYGIVAPAHTPPPVVNRLNAALREALMDPAFRAKMAASDVEILVRSPHEFGEFLSRERVKWGSAARSAKVQLEQ
jgi:tripartite-type tricarboxylate transporter receptor subunit TctC